MAVVGLGGHPIYVRPEEVGLGVRESVADVARTFAGFCSVIAARVFDHATLEEMAAVVDVPVVNLLSDRAHPTQAVADFLTLQELFGALDGRRLVYVGDGNNVTASLAYGAALERRRAHRRLAPRVRARRAHGRAGPQPRRHHRARGRPPRGGRGRRRGLHRRVDLDGAGGGAGDPPRRLRRVHRRRRADGRGAGPQAWFLHCLPAHRGEEVAASVIDGPRSVVWQQAANRMHAARAVLTHLVAPPRNRPT